MAVNTATLCMDGRQDTHAGEASTNDGHQPRCSALDDMIAAATVHAETLKLQMQDWNENFAPHSSPEPQSWHSALSEMQRTIRLPSPTGGSGNPLKEHQLQGAAQIATAAPHRHDTHTAGICFLVARLIHSPQPAAALLADDMGCAPTILSSSCLLRDGSGHAFRMSLIAWKSPLVCTVWGKPFKRLVSCSCSGGA